MKNYYILLLSLFLHQTYYSQNTEKETPVSLHGQLAIEDATLVNSQHNPVQLKGMSLFWSQWQPQFYNFETVKSLRDHWGVNVIRAAMAIEHDGTLRIPKEKRRKFSQS